MRLGLEIKPFAFSLVRPLKTFKGSIHTKRGWLLKIKNSYGDYGWGEIAPLHSSEIKDCEKILKKIGSSPLRHTIEENILSGPGALGFGLGSALAELDYLVGDKTDNSWLEAPVSSVLLPNNKKLLLTKLDSCVNNINDKNQSITVKWKVCTDSNQVEETLLHHILERLPQNSFLRIDANTGWNRQQANHWANYFIKDPRLEWLEQPLPANDIEGLLALSRKVPVALDESLITNPGLKSSWEGWQVRRPALEGDPRILLKELRNGKRHIAISTAFETGIGRRWIHHLSALQQKTATPTAPGLALEWCPVSSLFSKNPRKVWETV